MRCKSVILDWTETFPLKSVETTKICVHKLALVFSSDKYYSPKDALLAPIHNMVKFAGFIAFFPWISKSQFSTLFGPFQYHI